MRLAVNLRVTIWTMLTRKISEKMSSLSRMRLQLVWTPRMSLGWPQIVITPTKRSAWKRTPTFRCVYVAGQLLQRFYGQLHASNPALFSSNTKRYTIAPPQIMREGNKKSIFANIPDICKRMHRQPEHVIQFMFAEMGTTGSVDGSGRLVIKGRFQQKQIENVLRRYIGMISHVTSCLLLICADLHHSIVEYVTCKTCKSFDTLLTKENRIFFMSCMSCGSRRSVSAIKSGFQAQVGKRVKK
jgi:translation initiation factor 2 subunit 2